jgi:TolB-like protein
VLPFANLSPDPEDAWFADGLHEEILATLARARGLRGISRTSVQEYRNPKRNLREIARALDVALILERSVRRVGDDVWLTVQLIDGRNDEHLWAETYDRAFRDALQLQKTVALRVASELGTKVSPRERRGVARPACGGARCRRRSGTAAAEGALRRQWSQRGDSAGSTDQDAGTRRGRLRGARALAGRLRAAAARGRSAPLVAIAPP